MRESLVKVVITLDGWLIVLR